MGDSRYIIPADDFETAIKSLAYCKAWAESIEGDASKGTNINFDEILLLESELKYAIEKLTGERNE